MFMISFGLLRFLFYPGTPVGLLHRNVSPRGGSRSTWPRAAVAAAVRDDDLRSYAKKTGDVRLFMKAGIAIGYRSHTLYTSMFDCYTYPYPSLRLYGTPQLQP